MRLLLLTCQECDTEFKSITHGGSKSWSFQPACCIYWLVLHTDHVYLINNLKWV